MDKWTEDLQMAIDLAENCNDPASEFHGNSPPDTSKSRTRKGDVCESYSSLYMQYMLQGPCFKNKENQYGLFLSNFSSDRLHGSWFVGIKSYILFSLKNFRNAFNSSKWNCMQNSK